MKNFIFRFLAILIMAVPFNDVSAETIALPDGVAPFNTVLLLKGAAPEIVLPYGEELEVGKLFLFEKLDSLLLPQIIYQEQYFSSNPQICVKSGQTYNSFKNNSGDSYIQIGHHEDAGETCPDVAGMSVGKWTADADIIFVAEQGKEAVANIVVGNVHWLFFKIGAVL